MKPESQPQATEQTVKPLYVAPAMKKYPPIKASTGVTYYYYYYTYSYSGGGDYSYSS